jgi:murein DD-endopeptidase MepM/ murein hydrolase activator NlpD
MKAKSLLTAAAVTAMALAAGVAFGVPADPADVAAPPPQDAVAPVETRAQDPAELDLLLRRYDAEEKAASVELAAIEPELAQLDTRLVVRTRAYYRTAHAGLLPAGGGFDALVDHAANVERTRAALMRDIGRKQELAGKKEGLAKRIERIRAERAPLELHRQAMERARTALAQADERRAAFGRAFETSTAPPDYVAIYGADLGPNDGSASSAGFAGLRGKLPFPVAGRAEVRRLVKPGGGGTAMEMTSPGSAVARSVAPGRVVFADRYEDDGVTVILDHGEHYYTIYGNLVSSEVKVGDSLTAAARLGSVKTRGREGAVLYFELRHKGETIDPAPWLGL